MLGELLVTAGALVLLFALWQFWWTDVVADAAADDRVAALQESFALEAPDSPDADLAAPSTAPDDATAEPEGTQGTPDSADRDSDPGPGESQAPPSGSDLALVHLPTIGELRPVSQGVDLAILNLGVLGHYPSSDLPGEVGNFAVAGHRTTYGAPLWAIGELRTGDPVVVETARGWFVYAMDRTEIILPSQTEVIAPVPGEPGEDPTEAWMVMTPCHPKFSAEQRIAAFARLERFVPRTDGAPTEIGG